MDHATAKAIIAEIAPDLVIGPDDGAPHITVFKPGHTFEPPVPNEHGNIPPPPTPFSIALQKDDFEAFQLKQRREFEEAVKSARAHLGA